MSNLAVRVLAAVIGVPAVLVVMWVGGPLFHALVMLITYGAAWEYFSITGFKQDRKSFIFAMLLTLSFSLVTTLIPLRYLGPAVVASTMGIFLWYLFSFGEMATVVSRAGIMLLGVVYAGFLPTLLLHLRNLPEGRGWFLMLLAIVWLADTGAYFTGRAFGRHKMYPAVSPGKSWEGAVGGLAASVGGAFLAKAFFLQFLTPVEILILAIPAGALGQMGDLCESLIKRAYGVKDSGHSIPGHGGVLDRFDAIFFAAPVVYFFARIIH